jgi:hypothetical protein
MKKEDDDDDDDDDDGGGWRWAAMEKLVYLI